MIDDIVQTVQAAQHGDTKAVEQLYNQTYKAAYLAAKSIVQDQNDAPAIVKDSYLQAFYNINTLPNATEFDKWFNAILDRKAKEYLQGKQPQLFSEKYASQASLWADDKNTIAAGVSANITNSAMNTFYALPADQKLIAIMYYNQNMGVQEIADTLSISADEVKGALFMTKQATEQALAGYGVGQVTSSASVIFATLNSAAQTCIAPAGEIQGIIATLTGGAAPAANANTTAPMQSVANTQMPVAPNPINPIPASNAPKKGLSKGTKIALIAGGAAVVVAIVAIVLIIIFSGSSNNNPEAPTSPTIAGETTPTDEATDDTNDETSAPVSIDGVFDESFALPDNYKVPGGSYDKNKGYDSGFGLDEKKTIETFESFPEIKPIVDDKDAYIRYEVTQTADDDGVIRETFNYYSGDGATYSVFIDTNEGCVNPNRISLLFDGDDLNSLRATAKKLLETTSIDPQIINAVLYTDREDSDGIEVDGLGTYYFSNDLEEDSLDVFLTFYSGYEEVKDGIKAKYYEEDLSKYFDLATVMNNKDVDFNADLTKEGLGKFTSVNDAKNPERQDYSKTISYTTDQNGKIVEVECEVNDGIYFNADDDKLQTVNIDLDYGESDTYSDETATITVQVSYSDDSSINYSDAAKLACESFKFFDKDFSLSEKDLLLADEDDEISKDFTTKMNGGKDANVSAEVSSGSVIYTLEWNLD